MCSAEAYLAALLWDLRVLQQGSPSVWVRRHGALFSRYTDLDRLCSFLDGTGGRELELICRAARLSGAELEQKRGSGLHKLRSVFSRLAVGADVSDTPSYYDYHPLTTSDIFPVKNGGPLEETAIADLNCALTDAAKNPPKNLDAFLLLLDTIFKRCLWCVPAGEGDFVDISLYDKMRSTAAIFVCLEEVSSDEAQPYLLLAADFSGIQNYIFSAARTSIKGVSKRLRARSFLVDTMIQALSYEICDEIQIPYTNTLMLTGGKFYLLLPNNGEITEKLKALKRRVERELFRRFQGEISINLAWVAFGDEGLIDYSATVTELSQRLRREKSRGFHSVLTEGDVWEEEPFVLIHDLAGKQGCPSCGKRLMKAGHEICPECRMQEELGGELTGAKYLWFSRDGGEYPLWENCYLSFSQNRAKGKLIRVEQLNNWDIPASMMHLPFGVRLMASHLPKKGGEPLTFSDIGELSKGSKRLAVLKADVDNLGYLFADGMRSKTRHYGTISRVSTLSRLLEMFFSGYISYLLETEYTQVYSVFSGGDDLFLIGPWDVMAGMALRIQREFKRFSGGNPCVTLSAAILIADPKTNIALLAEQSEEELKRVKNSAPAALYPDKSGRNGVSFFGDIFSWEDFAAQLDNVERLRPAVSSVSVSILRRIGTYSQMYRKFLLDHDVMGLMFAPLLHYDQVRNYGKVQNADEFLQYAKALPKNAANYKEVNRNLYFAQTVITCILNQTKEARNNGI